MTTHYVTEKQLGKALRKEAAKVPKLLERAAVRAAHRGKARLVQATDEKGITDMGQYKNSFRVERGDARAPAAILNDAPHAGIIEFGARPHPVSQAGLDALAAWAMRKLGVDEDEARRVARAIARKLRREGQKPRHVFADEQASLSRFFREEFERALRGAGGAR